MMAGMEYLYANLLAINAVMSKESISQMLGAETVPAISVNRMSGICTSGLGPLPS